VVAGFSFTCASALDLDGPPTRVVAVNSSAGTPLIASLLKRLGQTALAAATLMLAACAAPTAAAPKLADDFVTQMPANVARLPRPRLGDDFYGYVNNQWLVTYKLPADKASFGAAEELADQAEREVRTMIEDAHRVTPGKGNDRTEDRRHLCRGPRREDDRGARARSDPSSPRPHSRGNHTRRYHPPDGCDRIRLPFNAGVAASPADPDANAVWISQAGLGMPHRGYYLDSGLQSAALQVAYRRHISTILGLIGEPDPDKAAQRIYNIEYRIAQAHTDEDRSIGADGSPCAR